MTQAYVDHMKKLSLAPEKTIIKNKINQVDKEKVKRQLFCEEQLPAIVKTGDFRRPATPLSYRNLSEPKWVVHFVGYKFPVDKALFCEACFRAINTGFRDDEPIPNEYLFLGEVTLYGKKQYQPTLDKFCIACSKKLFRITDCDSLGLTYNEQHHVI